MTPLTALVTGCARSWGSSATTAPVPGAVCLQGTKSIITTAAAIRNLKKGEISPPFEATDAAGKKIFKIVQLSTIIPAHKASLELDYSLLQNIALNEKKNQQLNEWIKEKQAATYIRIDESFRSCPFRIKGWSGSTP